MRERGKLEAETLAGAGRHHADHIVAVQDILDNLSLMRAELGELKDPSQEIVDGVHKTTLTCPMNRDPGANCKLFLAKQNRPAQHPQRLSLREFRYRPPLLPHSQSIAIGPEPLKISENATAANTMGNSKPPFFA